MHVEVLEVPRERLDDSVEATAYYVVAEAVANAQRHAHAHSLRILAGVSGDVLRVTVADDGIGGATEGAGSGLRGLRERVEEAGGTFRVVSPVGAGTRVDASLPVRTFIPNG
jgi:signal transduction histidine kinase